MKILTLHFKNLNSLLGEWSIDFRHSAYANEGIFAITGATGAGKTTILDAICLALYGATPRLGDITENKNDIMSRQAGECFAEVVFECHSGTYRCRWEQKRAYKKADGKLQSPKHEISEYIDDHTAGNLLEENARRTKKQVENMTGMDYQRFTRAMLLAQGSFSAFLQANADERSNLLEQITGTEIYGIISKKVHERCNDEKKRLEQLTEQLSIISALTEEQEQLLQQQKQLLQQNINDLKQQINQTKQHKNWRQHLDDIQNLQQQNQQALAELNIEMTKFMPQATQLQNAQKALTLQLDYQQIQHFQKQQQELITEKTTLQQQLENLTKKYQNSEKILNNHYDKYQQSEQAWQLAQPTLKQARLLDSNIHQLKQQRQQEQQKQQEQQEYYVVISEQQQEKQQDIAQLQQQIQQINQDNHEKYSQLPQIIALLQQLQQSFDAIDDNQTKQQLLNITQQLSENQVCHQEKTLQLQQRQQQSEENLLIFQQINSEIQQLLADKTLIEIRQNYDDLIKIDNKLTNILANCEKYQHIQTEIQKISQEKQQTSQQLEQAKQQQQQLEQQQSYLQKTLDLLLDRKTLLIKIKNLEEERQQLQANKPCPLCGSTHHPFVQQTFNQDDISTSEQSYQQTKQALATVSTDNQEKLIYIQSLTKDLELQNTQQQQLQQQIVQNEQIIYQQFQQLFAQDEQDNLPEKWSMIEIEKYCLNQQNTVQQQQLTQQQRLQQLEKLQEKYQQFQQRQIQFNEQRQQTQTELTVLMTDIRQQQKQIQYLTDTLHQQQQQKQKIHQQIIDLCNPYTDNIEVYFSTNVELLSNIQQLQTLFDDWQQQQKSLVGLQEKLQVKQQELTAISSKMEQIQIILQQYQQQIVLSTKQLSELQQNRQQILANNDTDNVEDILSQSKQKAYDIWQVSQKEYHSLKEQWQQQHYKLDTIYQSLDKETNHLDKLKNEFLQKLKSQGFLDELDYQNACLSEKTMEELLQIKNKLDRHHQNLSEKQQQLMKEYQELKQQNCTKLSLLELQQQLSEQDEQLNMMLQNIGGIHQKLSDNLQSKQQQQHLLDKIKQQRSSTEHWQQLHQLIGSSDGKKYRNFAQNLTFNMMIGYANEQLQKMSDRYLLLADNEQALMLNVMDNYQGGQVRTSKNLSGGESFIVSLALALGLSNMASHRMQVNSLFLDEGFGTLDEEALDVALDTLTTLQQTGKLIGVISHVQALKERIHSQIIVKAETGGVSRIIGAGCKQHHG